MFAHVIPIQRMPRQTSAFTYAIPLSLQSAVRPGMLVHVPWRKSRIQAVVESVQQTTDFNNPAEISGLVLNEPIWSQAHVDAFVRESRRQHISFGTLAQSLLPDVPQRRRQIPEKSAQLHSSPAIAATISRDVIPWLQEVSGTPSSSNAIWTHRLADRHYLYRQWCSQTKQQVLILVPQLLDALELQAALSTMLKEPVAVWGEHMNKTERWTLFTNIHAGSYRIVVTTRSGVFLPLRNLGKIIIDQEDRQDHRSWEGSPYYDSRDLARDLAKGLSIDAHETSFHPRLLRLLEKTYTQSPPLQAPITTYFYRSSKELMHPELLDHVKDTVASGLDVLFVCNKKAAHAGLACLDCQYQWACPTCSSRLQHGHKTVFCPVCDYSAPEPLSCPRCTGSNIRGYTAGGEAVAEYLKNAVGAITYQLSSDDDGVAVGAEGKPHIIVSTPFTWRRLALRASPRRVGLVVLFHPESILYTPDTRANEWYVQFIQWHNHMAYGYYRANLFIQTGLPETSNLHQLAVNGSLQELATQETEMRQRMMMPPFGQIHLLRLKSAVETDVNAINARLRADFPNARIYGPKQVRGSKEQQWMLVSPASEGRLDKLDDSIYSKLLVYFNPEVPIFA